jgi:replication initiation and membrane attachment protein
MKIMQSKDFIQIRLESVISSQDHEFLTEFYGPLIGLDAIGLYLALKQYEGLLDQEVIAVEAWLTLIQSAPQQFHQARLQLEALGLLRTYQQSFEQTQLYTLSLYAPKPPHDFFHDPLLKGLLLQRIGTAALKRLETKYLTTALPKDAIEISSSFGEVFHPDLNHPAFVLSNQPQVKGKTLAEIRKPFDRILFAEQLKVEFSLDINKLHPDDLDEAVTIATLVGLDELAMANLFGTFLDAQYRLMRPQFIQAARQEKRLPFVRQRQQQKFQFQETSTQAVLINQLEMMAPVEFLSSRQRGAEVSPADFSLLIRLQQQYHLPNPVINALIYHVLTTQNNVLSSRLVEKIAGSLSRVNLSHASDVLDYFLQLSQSNYPQNKRTTSKQNGGQEQPTNESNTPQSSPIIDDHELNTLEEQVKGLK